MLKASFEKLFSLVLVYFYIVRQPFKMILGLFIIINLKLSLPTMILHIKRILLFLVFIPIVLQAQEKFTLKWNYN